MLTFIDVNKFKGKGPEEKPSTAHFSFSDKSFPNRLFVSSLHHGDELTFDKVNAQKLIDFLQKNVIDAPEV
jgi:hypothetical protein